MQSGCVDPKLCNPLRRYSFVELRSFVNVEHQRIPSSTALTRSSETKVYFQWDCIYTRFIDGEKVSS